ncbi:hypothetical protein PRIPAC_98137, partial [Pristionchus pacificus]|uniref:Uncharacterized protein n=1 Tax=Pristionchus pacificus TaxID=54126 RepID=A0A2A6BVS9_PRIPA
ISECTIANPKFASPKYTFVTFLCISHNYILSMHQLYPVFAWLPGPLRGLSEDSVVASAAGTYKVWLSNARSWWSSITIQHHFEVIKRED